MLFRLASLILFLMLAAMLANWLGAQPGNLRVEWLDWRIEVRTSLAITALVIGMVILIFADRLWRRIVTLPGWLGTSMKQRREIAGHKALSQGLMAVSAGEPAEANRQAARARRLLNAPELTDLLAAQAAHLAGDHKAAERYFRSLTKVQDTAFLGYIGLARLAQAETRQDDALAAIRRAVAIKPKSAMAAAQLVGLEAARGDWAAAATALDVVMRAKPLPGSSRHECEMRYHQKAALAFLQARAILDAEDGAASADRNRLKQAERHLDDAIAADPCFWPAILRLADLHLQQGNSRKASRVLETGFGKVPHRDLADRLKTAWNKNDGAYLARLIRLVPQGADDVADDAAIIVAKIALETGIDGEARGLLARIPDPRKDVGAWNLMAELAELDDDAPGISRALRAAGSAPRPRGWQCDSCHVLSGEWQSHCQSCGGLATLVWQRPEHLTPLAPAEDGPTPALPKAGPTDD